MSCSYHIANIILITDICVKVVGLLLPRQTMVTTVFWQWLNQSHNAAVNYANRNASEVFLTLMSRVF